MAKSSTFAVSRSTVVASLVVGVFVALVIVGLYYAYFGITGSVKPCQPTQPNSKICLSSVQLYSGSPSTVNLSQNCTGDATFVVEGYNLSSNVTFHLRNATIFGGTLKQNATTLVSVYPNSCLALQDTNPEIPPSSYFTFTGYITSGLLVDSTYQYAVSFDNGLVQSGTIIAQSE